MKGRKPVPTADLKVRGTFKKYRRQGEPEFDKTDATTAPEWLNDLATEEWVRIAPVLAAKSVLTEVDMSSMAGYCQNYAKAIMAEEMIEKDGMTVTGGSGGLKPHPAIAIANSAWDRCLKFAQDLGITPSSRSRLNIGNNERTTATGRAKFIRNG